jgi:glutathione synthase/RimK-type ligase-like ATP-grasp enzyme
VVGSLERPVLNHPRKAAVATRQRNAERLEGIKDTVVPRTLRFFNEPARRGDLAQEIESHFDYPVIVRTPFAQEGKGMWRPNSRSALIDSLAMMGEQQFYAIQYIDNPNEYGLYRKIRAVVIGDQIFITHAHFSNGWCVHRPTEEEEKGYVELDSTIRDYKTSVVAHPGMTLGETVMEALREIRSRLPLDLFGIDFDVTREGKLLLFEANATMRIAFAQKGRSAEEDKARHDAIVALDALFRTFAGAGHT